MKMMHISKRLLPILIFIPFIGACQGISADNSGDRNRNERMSIEHSHKIAGLSTESVSMEEKNELGILDNEDQHALDIYLDLHRRWRFGNQNISRSDSCQMNNTNAQSHSG